MQTMVVRRTFLKIYNILQTAAVLYELDIKPLLKTFHVFRRIVEFYKFNELNIDPGNSEIGVRLSN